MKKIILAIVVGLVSLSAWASETDEIQQCLKKWPNHPFNAKNPVFRTISSKVKVLGIGSNVHDTDQTEKPELVLVKPGVAVMSKTTYELMNHNGWYCLKGKVSVLGKIEMTLHCKAKIASTGDGTEVLGASDEKSGGVSVLGSVRIKRYCP